MVCLALELLGMEAFDELLSINVPWIQFSDVLRIWT